MRKTVIIFMLILLTGSLNAATNNKFAVRLTACGLRPSDADYRDVYAQIVLLPRLELAYNFPAGLSAWIAYGWLKKNGQGPLSGIACSSSQQFLAAGPAYTTTISETVALRLAAGPSLIFYREKAGSYTSSGNTIGADINATLTWTFSPSLALEGRIGYLLASDSIDGSERFKLGGPWGGLGMVVIF